MSTSEHHFILYAAHTQHGGGLTYLHGILPELAKMENTRWTVITPSKISLVPLPKGVEVLHWDLPKNFVLKHLYEQFVVPFKLRALKAKAVLCNANYVPLLAPNPMPILHNDPSSSSQRLYWWALKQLTKLGLWRAKTAFSVSAGIVPYYAKGKAAQKITIAAPGLPDLPWQAPPLRVKNKIIAVGDMYPQKNYPLLVDAFAKLQSKLPVTKLEIIGDTLHEQTVAQIEQKIAEHKLAGKVKLHGKLAHKQALKHIAEASVLVNLSEAESVCLPVLEAMQCGTPVVSNDLPAVVDAAGPAVVYVSLDKGGDLSAAVAIALLGVLSDLTIAKHLGTMGQQKIAERTWVHTGNAMRDTLQKYL